MDQFHVLGLMSGSSLDGLDIAECKIERIEGKWSFQLGACECIPLPDDLLAKINTASQSSSRNQKELHSDFALFTITACQGFFKKRQFDAPLDLITSHGHTIYHYPHEGTTLQVGDGALIAQELKVPIVSDLRIHDIKKGGQGAPIVPVADVELFSEYRAWINLGGIANITLKNQLDHSVQAFDITACNQVLNRLAQRLGQPYDDQGEIARTGSVNNQLLSKLKAIPYHLQEPPKSLDNSFSIEEVLPILSEREWAIPDTLRTYTSHIAHMITESVKKRGITGAQILITGGGAKNTFLIEEIQKADPANNYIVPSDKVVDFKEALAMAFFGVLKWLDETNIYASVTGASSDTSGGIIHHP